MPELKESKRNGWKFKACKCVCGESTCKRDREIKLRKKNRLKKQMTHWIPSDGNSVTLDAAQSVLLSLKINWEKNNEVLVFRKFLGKTNRIKQMCLLKDDQFTSVRRKDYLYVKKYLFYKLTKRFYMNPQKALWLSSSYKASYITIFPAFCNTRNQSLMLGNTLTVTR